MDSSQRPMLLSIFRSLPTTPDYARGLELEVDNKIRTSSALPQNVELAPAAFQPYTGSTIL